MLHPLPIPNFPVSCKIHLYPIYHHGQFGQVSAAFQAIASWMVAPSPRLQPRQRRDSHPVDRRLLHFREGSRSNRA